MRHPSRQPDTLVTQGYHTAHQGLCVIDRDFDVIDTRVQFHSACPSVCSSLMRFILSVYFFFSLIKSTRCILSVDFNYFFGNNTSINEFSSTSICFPCPLPPGSFYETDAFWAGIPNNDAVPWRKHFLQITNQDGGDDIIGSPVAEFTPSLPL